MSPLGYESEMRRSKKMNEANAIRAESSLNGMVAMKALRPATHHPFRRADSGAGKASKKASRRAATAPPLNSTTPARFVQTVRTAL